jgi:hypothetical protein
VGGKMELCLVSEFLPFRVNECKLHPIL